MTGAFFGQPLRRLEDQRLLPGEATFIDDLRLPGVLHVAFVRSAHAHARIRVDASPVLARPDAPGIFFAGDFDPGGVPGIPPLTASPTFTKMSQDVE